MLFIVQDIYPANIMLFIGQDNHSADIMLCCLLVRTFTLLRQVAFDRIVEIQGLTLSGIIQYVRRFAPPDRVEDIISKF